MASPIEEIIEDLEEYIESCKPSAFSQSKIIVNRDEIEVLISELKSKIPEEVNRYQKIINNQEAIIADAKRQAKEIIEAAQIHTNELVSEHKIMEQAYAEANKVVFIATKDAQNTLDSAYSEANEIRRSAIAYTDDLLKNIQEVLVKSIDATRTRQDSFITTMQGYLDTVVDNRTQLTPNPIAEELINATSAKVPSIEDVPPAAPSEPESSNQFEETTPFETSDEEDSSVASVDEPTTAPATTGVIDIPDSFFKKD